MMLSAAGNLVLRWWKLGADSAIVIREFTNNCFYGFLCQEKKTKKEKAVSKRMKKMVDEEKRWQEKEFERSFFREFWPDNV